MIESLVDELNVWDEVLALRIHPPGEVVCWADSRLREVADALLSFLISAQISFGLIRIEGGGIGHHFS